jgi:hypothetical protein
MTSLQTSTGLTGLIQWMTVAPHHTTVAQVTSDTSRHKTAEQARIAFSHVLPHLDGANLKATVVEVTTDPGSLIRLTVTLRCHRVHHLKRRVGHRRRAKPRPLARLANVSTKLPTVFIGSLPMRVANLR